MSLFKVSICVPTFNRGNFLVTTMPTILAQTFSDFELIICDDNSTDNTSDVIKSFTDPRIRYIKNNQNQGIPKILNTLVSFARGEYIMFLHDHDLYDPNLLREMIRVLDCNIEVGYVFCESQIIDDKGNIMQYNTLPYPEVIKSKKMVNNILHRFKFDCPVSALVMVRSSVLYKTSNDCIFNEDFGFISDVDLWIRLAMKYSVGYVAKPLMKLREREKEHPFKKPNWKLFFLIGNVYRTNTKKYYTSKPILKIIAMCWFWIRYGLMGTRQLARVLKEL